MERVRPNKAPTPPALADKPVRQRPARSSVDPAELPAFDTHGYGPLVCLGHKTGIALSYRIKGGVVLGDAQVRVYYAGAFLIGVVCISPTLVTASFRHNMKGPDHVSYPDEATMHRAVFAMLSEQPE